MPDAAEVSTIATNIGKAVCVLLKLIDGLAMSDVGVYVPVSYSKPEPPPATFTITSASVVTSTVPFCVIVWLPSTHGNVAVPPPLFGNCTPDTPLYVAPSKLIVGFAMTAPPN